MASSRTIHRSHDHEHAPPPSSRTLYLTPDAFEDLCVWVGDYLTSGELPLYPRSIGTRCIERVSREFVKTMSAYRRSHLGRWIRRGEIEALLLRAGIEPNPGPKTSRLPLTEPTPRPGVVLHAPTYKRTIRHYLTRGCLDHKVTYDKRGVPVLLVGVELNPGPGMLVLVFMLALTSGDWFSPPTQCPAVGAVEWHQRTCATAALFSRTATRRMILLQLLRSGVEPNPGPPGRGKKLILPEARKVNFTRPSQRKVQDALLGDALTAQNVLAKQVLILLTAHYNDGGYKQEVAGLADYLGMLGPPGLAAIMEKAKSGEKFTPTSLAALQTQHEVAPGAVVQPTVPVPAKSEKHDDAQNPAPPAVVQEPVAVQAAVSRAASAGGSPPAPAVPEPGELRAALNAAWAVPLPTPGQGPLIAPTPVRAQVTPGFLTVPASSPIVSPLSSSSSSSSAAGAPSGARTVVMAPPSGASVPQGTAPPLPPGGLAEVEKANVELLIVPKGPKAPDVPPGPAGREASPQQGRLETVATRARPLTPVDLMDPFPELSVPVGPDNWVNLRWRGHRKIKEAKKDDPTKFVYVDYAPLFVVVPPMNDPVRLWHMKRMAGKFNHSPVGRPTVPLIVKAAVRAACRSIHNHSAPTTQPVSVAKMVQSGPEVIDGYHVMQGFNASQPGLSAWEEKIVKTRRNVLRGSVRQAWVETNEIHGTDLNEHRSGNFRHVAPYKAGVVITKIQSFANYLVDVGDGDFWQLNPVPRHLVLPLLVIIIGASVFTTLWTTAGHQMPYWEQVSIHTVVVGLVTLLLLHKYPVWVPVGTPCQSDPVEYLYCPNLLSGLLTESSWNLDTLQRAGKQMCLRLAPPFLFPADLAPIILRDTLLVAMIVLEHSQDFHSRPTPSGSVSAGLQVV